MCLSNRPLPAVAVAVLEANKSFVDADVRNEATKSEAHLGRGKDKFVSFCCSDDDDAYPALNDIAETDISTSAMARYFFFL